MDRPWENEPELVDFEHGGFRCAMRRNGGGAWCGYIGVPKGHPWYGKDYDNIPADCHGGLTYSAKGNHIEPESELWWIGFDCSHYGDLAPKYAEEGLWRDGVYRDVAYVKNDVLKLAEAAKAA